VLREYFLDFIAIASGVIFQILDLPLCALSVSCWGNSCVDDGFHRSIKSLIFVNPVEGVYSVCLIDLFEHTPFLTILICVADKGTNPHTAPLTLFTIHKRDNTLGKSRHCSDRINRLSWRERRNSRAPELTDGLSIGFKEIAVDNAITKAVDKFVAFGHLKGSEESIIATVNGVGCDNHFLLADSHNLSIHCIAFWGLNILLISRPCKCACGSIQRCY